MAIVTYALHEITCIFEVQVELFFKYNFKISNLYFRNKYMSLF